MLTCCAMSSRLEPDRNTDKAAFWLVQLLMVKMVRGVVMRRKGAMMAASRRRRVRTTRASQTTRGVSSRPPRARVSKCGPAPMAKTAMGTHTLMLSLSSIRLHSTSLSLSMLWISPPLSTPHTGLLNP